MSDVRFIALYEDGSEEPFDVPQHTLRNGDWIVRIIARERQVELCPRRLKRNRKPRHETHAWLLRGTQHE